MAPAVIVLCAQRGSNKDPSTSSRLCFSLLGWPSSLLHQCSAGRQPRNRETRATGQSAPSLDESGAEETVGGGQCVFRMTFFQCSSNITWSLRPQSLDTLFAPNSHASTFHNPFKAPFLRPYITLVPSNFNLSMASLIEIARGQATRYKWLICGSMLGCAFGYSFCAGALVLSKV